MLAGQKKTGYFVAAEASPGFIGIVFEGGPIIGRLFTAVVVEGCNVHCGGYADERFTRAEGVGYGDGGEVIGWGGQDSGGDAGEKEEYGCCRDALHLILIVNLYVLGCK